MNIFVVSSKPTDKMRSFEFYLRANGCNVHVVSPGTIALPPFSEETSGVVLFFDDGEQSVTEWVARIREHTRYLSIPVIAVAARPVKDVHARILAAGAAVVCEADATNEQILTEVRTRCNVQPVLTEIRENLLGPFTNATTHTLREMAATEITVRSVYQKTGYRMFGDISAVIGLLARAEGSMVISFPDATAVAIVKRVLAGIADDPGADMIRDCVGELANVIAGQAKGILANTPYEFTLATPTVVAGAGHEIRHKPGMPCLVIAFGSELGDFGLQLCMGIPAAI